MMLALSALAYIRLPHFVPVIAVLGATGALAWLIGGDDLDIMTMLRLLLAMLGGQLVVGVVNEMVDEPFDLQTKPEKPLPSGQVSHTGAYAMGIVGVILMLVIWWVIWLGIVAPPLDRNRYRGDLQHLV